MADPLATGDPFLANTDRAWFDFLSSRAGERDVQIAIDFCGVCHSDIHNARDEWGGTIYPCVPGVTPAR